MGKGIRSGTPNGRGGTPHAPLPPWGCGGRRDTGGRAVFLHTEEILENGETCKSITGHRSGRRPRSGEPMRQQDPGADQERGTDQGREIPERIREGKR